jgi:hypothetical protein
VIDPARLPDLDPAYFELQQNTRGVALLRRDERKAGEAPLLGPWGPLC